MLKWFLPVLYVSCVSVEKPSAEVHGVQCLPCGFHGSSSWVIVKQNQAVLPYTIGYTYPNDCVHIGDPLRDMNILRTWIAEVCWMLMGLGRLVSLKNTHSWQKALCAMGWGPQERPAWLLNKLKTRLGGSNWQSCWLLFGLLQCTLGLSWSSDAWSLSEKRN